MGRLNIPVIDGDCSSDIVVCGGACIQKKKAFVFFIFSHEVVIICFVSPSFLCNSQVFCLFAFTHAETCALKLSGKHPCDVPFPLSCAGMLQSHNNMEMERLQVRDLDPYKTHNQCNEAHLLIKDPHQNTFNEHSSA